jgi:hypothetical protein
MQSGGHAMTNLTTISPGKRTGTVVLVVITMVCIAGCVGFKTKHLERIPREDRNLKTAVTPEIDVAFDVLSTPGASGPRYLAKLRKRFGALQGRFDYLANAREGNSDADYRLEFSVQETEKIWGSPELTGTSFFLIPMSVLVTREHLATLSDREGDELFRHTARTKTRTIIQMHTLYLAPLYLFSVPNYLTAEKKAMCSLISLIEKDIAKDPRFHSLTLLGIESKDEPGNRSETVALQHRDQARS